MMSRRENEAKLLGMIMQEQAHLARSAMAHDSVQRAEHVAALVVYVEDELVARDPSYYELICLERVGLKAGALFGQLSMLLKHPDLLVLALKRAVAELARETVPPQDA